MYASNRFRFDRRSGCTRTCGHASCVSAPAGRPLDTRRAGPGTPMSAVNVVILLLYGLGMSVGQVMFKIAADRAKARAAGGFLEPLVTDGYFLAAVALYGALTILWVWIMTSVPL